MAPLSVSSTEESSPAAVFVPQPLGESFALGIGGLALQGARGSWVSVVPQPPSTGETEDAEGRDVLALPLQRQQKSWLANRSLSRSSVMFSIN